MLYRHVVSLVWTEHVSETTVICKSLFAGQVRFVNQQLWLFNQPDFSKL